MLFLIGLKLSNSMLQFTHDRKPESMQKDSLSFLSARSENLPTQCCTRYLIRARPPIMDQGKLRPSFSIACDMPNMLRSRSACTPPFDTSTLDPLVTVVTLILSPPGLVSPSPDKLCNCSPKSSKIRNRRSPSQSSFYSNRFRLPVRRE